MPTVNEYPQGELVRATGTFVDALALTPVDPAVVHFQLQVPGQPGITYTYGVDVQVVRDSAGVYHIDLDTTPAAGLWTGRWYSTGTGQASVPWAAFVIPYPAASSGVPPPLGIGPQGPPGATGPAGPAPAGGSDGDVVQRVGGVPAWRTWAGDVSGPASANRVAKLQGNPISLSSPATGDVPQWNGSAWVSASNRALPALTRPGDVLEVGNAAPIWGDAFAISNVALTGASMQQVGTSVDVALLGYARAFGANVYRFRVLARAAGDQSFGGNAYGAIFERIWYVTTVDGFAFGAPSAPFDIIIPFRFGTGGNAALAAALDLGFVQESVNGSVFHVTARASANADSVAWTARVEVATV